jgi:molybdopterin-containing oxidoreductase family iron-sulfur binding subunit
MGLGSIAFAYGCNQNQNKNLFSLVQAPEDMITGKATWYASTCLECPAGCGVIAKNREGRVIKLEGNPLHPINQGKLCVRGQAALQSIYDPDRVLKPKLKVEGRLVDIDFFQAQKILEQRLQQASAKGTNSIKMISSIVSQPLFNLFTQVLNERDANPPVIYEPFAHEAIRDANRILFGNDVIPSVQMEKADFILGFGADFLETWLSPVEYARKFKQMHAINNGKKGVFIHVGPYMSLTAANADKFLSVQPNKEVMVVLGLIKHFLDLGTADHLPNNIVAELKTLVADFDAKHIEKNTGLSPDNQKIILQQLKKAQQPLILGGSSPSESSLALEISVGLLNLIVDGTLSLFDFNRRHAIEKVSSTSELSRFFKDALLGSTELMLFYQTNPLHSLTDNPDLQRIIKDNKIFKVCFSSVLDETAIQADLIFPVRLSLESWDVYQGTSDIVSALQPAMGKLTQAPAIGDVFINLSDKNKKSGDYQRYLIDLLISKNEISNIESWFKMLQKGGRFTTHSSSGKNEFTLQATSIIILKKELESVSFDNSRSMQFMAVPSIRYFDGRGANKAWLSEIPDSITSICWDSLILAHPNTLKKNGVTQGDIVSLTANGKSIQAPVYAYQGVYPNLFVMQIGQGHKNYGRFAEAVGSNPFELLNHLPKAVIRPLSFFTQVSHTKKIGRVENLAKTDGSRSQYKRKIALSQEVNGQSYSREKKEGLTMNTFPLTLPIEEGYDDKRDVYNAHKHDTYRWGMVVDLDRCIGCSACVGACYAENNIGVVGKKQIAQGREMSWLRIERYEDQKDNEKLIFLPMMCQHCDNAPCESVCPVYAPHHSKEGLNNQIYNRCIGTRFCAQNCPYKVRRFNWFDWKWPEPLNLQLNPDVTARSKGVMEKCSFCIQRIKRAHNIAKNENRKIKDGEIQPACVQTCPTNALVFGNFLDETSTLRSLAKDPRAYQVLGYLNTKPAVIYLKKINQKL